MSRAAGPGRTGTGGGLRARFVVPEPGRVLAPGEIVWDDRGRVTALRRARGGAAVADVCVLPGLVNAHVHLQLEHASGAPRAFVPWVRAVLAARAAARPALERARVRAELRALLADGTTAVGEIDSSGASGAVLAASGVGGRCYRELTGFHLGRAAARALVAQRWREAATGSGAARRGLSPHAPYSVSPELFRAAARASRHLAIHCAEVPEEQQLLHTGSGPFADLLAELGRLPKRFRAPRVGAVRWLERLGVLRPTTALVHCQELERGDLGRIAAAGASIVVCPGTILHFRRALPPVPAWLGAGVPVALGTDSLASNTALSTRLELQRAARAWPALAPQQLLAMATTHGARALGLPRAGRLVPGGRADLVVVPAAATFAATLEQFVHGELAPRAVLLAGLPRAPRARGGR